MHKSHAQALSRAVRRRPRAPAADLLDDRGIRRSPASLRTGAVGLEVMHRFIERLFGTDPNYRRLIFWSIGLSTVIAVLLVLERWG